MYELDQFEYPHPPTRQTGARKRKFPYMKTAASRSKEGVTDLTGRDSWRVGLCMFALWPYSAASHLHFRQDVAQREVPSGKPYFILVRTVIGFKLYIMSRHSGAKERVAALDRFCSRKLTVGLSLPMC